MKKILPFLFFLILGAWAWWYLSSFQDFSVGRIDQVGSGGGLCLLYAYDSEGNRYDYFYGQLSDHDPGKQVFLISQEDLLGAGYIDEIKVQECNEYPQNVSPADASKLGVPLVPVRFAATFPSEKIRKGSSLILTARVEVVDPDEAERWIAIEEGGTAPLEFQIQQANFTFSPSNEEMEPVLLSRLFPAEAQWVVAPKESASGPQTILVLVIGDQFGGRYELEVQVVSSFGSLPVYAGVITTLVGWLANSLDIVERAGRLFKRKQPNNPDGPAADQPGE